MTEDLFTRLARRAIDDGPGVRPLVEDPWAGLVDEEGDEPAPAPSPFPAPAPSSPTPPEGRDAGRRARVRAVDATTAGARPFDARTAEPSTAVDVAAGRRPEAAGETTTVAPSVVIHDPPTPLDGVQRLASRAELSAPVAVTARPHRAEPQAAAQMVMPRPTAPPVAVDRARPTGDPPPSEAPTIEITIGRIDVHPAGHRRRDDPSTSPRRSGDDVGTRPAAPVTLADYLARRSPHR